MALVVLDTDVTSRVIKKAVPPTLAAKLVGRQMIVTFVTVGELSRWLHMRDLGSRRRALVEGWINSEAIGGSAEVARTWGEITARSQMRGRPRPYDDSWIAACCLTYKLPLATLNLKHFEDYATHHGLEIISG